MLACEGVQINAPILPGFETILSKEALELVAGKLPEKRIVLALVLAHPEGGRVLGRLGPGVGHGRLAGPGHRHRRVHAVPACLVGRRGDHATAAFA